MKHSQKSCYFCVVFRICCSSQVKTYKTCDLFALHIFFPLARAQFIETVAFRDKHIIYCDFFVMFFIVFHFILMTLFVYVFIHVWREKFICLRFFICLFICWSHLKTVLLVKSFKIKMHAKDQSNKTVRWWILLEWKKSLFWSQIEEQKCAIETIRAHTKQNEQQSKVFWCVSWHFFHVATTIKRQI